MKKIFIFILLLFPCVVFAQEDYNSRLQEQLNSIYRLKQDTTQLNDSIAKEKERLYQLKKTWYDICINYLMEGKFKTDELDKLIKDTKREIDGEKLYNELIRAKTCYEVGESYMFQTVPPPTKDDSKSYNGTKKKVVSKDDSSKKSEKKDPEVKKNEKKEKKDSKPPVEEPKSPTTPVANPEVKDKPIESDPKKDKPGDEKVIVETPIKNDNPPVDPEAPKKSDPVAPVKKKNKKTDKGEMEEGMSKKAKNNDGSN